jgi:hypothetical protein
MVDGVPDEYVQASWKYIAAAQWSVFETQLRG